MHPKPHTLACTLAKKDAGDKLLAQTAQMESPRHRPARRKAVSGRGYSLSFSSTNQTGIEIAFPDFLPITLNLIWR